MATRPSRKVGETGARRVTPSADRERRLHALGFRTVAGLDEAGRGCWAGPLVAGAVILPAITPGLRRSLAGLRDSKQLSPAQRERLFEVIRRLAVAVGVGVVEAPVIDLLGLGAAGRLALERAARELSPAADYLLVDAFSVPGVTCPQEGIIHGDAVCLSIAAASVIAKVDRDRRLTALGERYPGYGLERHRGYGTAEHSRALAELGPTAEHRLSFEPVRVILESWTAASPRRSSAAAASSLLPTI